MSGVRVPSVTPPRLPWSASQGQAGRSRYIGTNFSTLSAEILPMYLTDVPRSGVPSEHRSACRTPFGFQRASDESIAGRGRQRTLMTSLAERFEAKVDRSGPHHLWLGATQQNGAGFLKVDGRPTTAHRVAWELAHGSLEPGQKVVSCPEVKIRVRVEHLSLATASRNGRTPRRRAKGGGTKVEVRPGANHRAAPAGLIRRRPVAHGRCAAPLPGLGDVGAAGCLVAEAAHRCGCRRGLHARGTVRCGDRGDTPRLLRRQPHRHGAAHRAGPWRSAARRRFASWPSTAAGDRFGSRSGT
jgi:hypothetical protein